MANYLKKTASPRKGVTCNAWDGASVVINLKTGKAHITIDGMNSGQDIADGEPKIDTINIPIDDVNNFTNWAALYAEVIGHIITEPGGLLEGATLEVVPDTTV